MNEAATVLPQVTRNLKEHEREMTAAADERATMPSLLRRLAKKFKFTPHLKQTIRI